MSKQRIKLGIIGVGNIGSKHCRYILDGETPDILLTAVADRDSKRLIWAKENLPGAVQLFNEGEDLILNAGCDAVLIATPHDQHPGLAMKAFEAGLHVMCEKPAGVDTLQVREMNMAADAHPGLAFGMMFNQRANPIYQKIHQMLLQGELGEIKRVNWLITDWYRAQSYYDSGAWRATWAGEGGGVLLNQCPHQLDLLQWLCGMPKRVHAFVHEGKWHDIEVEDDVTAYLEYENGATGVFITSTADAPGTNRLEITGTRGRLVCEGDQITFDLLKVDEREFCFTSNEGFKKPPMETIKVVVEGENPHHAGVMRAFSSHILYGTPLLADGREGIFGLTLSNAMHLSSWMKQTITLPMDEQLFLTELNKRRATSRFKAGPSIALDTEGSY